MRPALPDLAVALATLGFALLCGAFAWQPGLATFADDSVSYLVMAQVFSPWHPASLPVAEAFGREAFYPPLYPLLLAGTGVAHNIALAHALTVFLLAACLPLVYVLGIRYLGDRRAAAAAAAVTALLPSLWIHVKGLLSEPLFCLLLLAILCTLESTGERRPRPWMLAALMAALALTRTVGLIVAAAYVLWALTQRGEPLSARARALLPAFAAALAYAAWVLLRPVATSDDYLRIVLEHGRGILAQDGFWAPIAASLQRQAGSLAEAWTGALLLFWVEGRPARVALAGVIGSLALAGMALRLVAGKADAWMIGAYLATFLLWPFYDQMTRFLFPALPVLVLYAFYAVGAGLRALKRAPGMAHALLTLLLVSLVAPGLIFIHQRAGAPSRHVEITDWYRTPDLDEARTRAEVHLGLMADMEAIRALTRPGDRIMWVAPSYIALLAGRRGLLAPAPAPADEYRRAVQEANPDYVFLSVYHPRDTIRDTAWRAGMAAMAGHGEIVHTRVRPNGSLDSVLVKMPPRGSSS